ncbi:MULTISPECIES: hypothetical protein [unclassified Nocardioides]|uniref:hypothetical protein n=1 Tax=unclassified Nocardioides TaxID=2615069 RepID=UPI0030142A83
MNPLPAAEVRRRGDRMRRRNNALAAVGGVAAALVVIAAPVAVITQQGTDDPSPPVATQTTEAPRVSWLQEIPADLDVAAGLAAGAETSDEPGVSQLTLCDQTAFDAERQTVDVAGAVSRGRPNTDESVLSRTLALYPDDAAAATAVADLRDAARSCPSAAGAADGDTTRTRVDNAQLAADESLVVTEGYYGDGDDYPSLGVDYVVVARTGNAVLVTVTPGITVDDQKIQDVQDDVTDVVSAMKAFSPEPD